MDIYSADGEDYRVVRNIYLFAVDGQRGNKLLNGVLLAGIIGIGAVVGLILRLIVGLSPQAVKAENAIITAANKAMVFKNLFI